VSFQDVIARTWNEHILYSVLVELTYRCNLDCFFCYNDLSSRGKPLTLSQYEGFLADLQGMGVMQFSLTGGEPLAHPEFFEIGGRARELGFLVRVKSNGHALRGKLARRLKDEIDPFVVEVSLHGASGETHDRQTRVPGSFERLMGNLRIMKEAGLRVQLNSTLTAWNEGELEQMFALADGLGLRLQVDARVTPRDDGDVEPLKISVSGEGLARLYRFQRDRAAAARGTQPAGPDPLAQKPVVKKHCGAGSSTVAVDPWGNVYPCVQWRTPIGNLHQESIKEIWEASPRLRQVRDANVRIKHMVDGYGKAAKDAGFCPGLAEQMQGTTTKLDPPTLRRVKLLESLDERPVE